MHPSWFAYSDQPEAEAELLRLTGADYVWHCDLAYGILRRCASVPFVVGGDWNTARLFQETRYDDARVSGAMCTERSAAATVLLNRSHRPTVREPAAPRDRH